MSQAPPGAGPSAPATSPQSSDDKEKTIFGPFVAIVGGSATVASFWTDYGFVALGIATIVFSGLALFHLTNDESLENWLRRKHPRKLVWLTYGLIAIGIGVTIAGAIYSRSVIDWFRPEFAVKTIHKRSYAGAAAPWQSLPAGSAEDVEIAFKLAGWKRLMNTAITNDPQNVKDANRQLFYVESTAFDRSYRTFTAELELPTNVMVSEVYAFLMKDNSSRSSHEELESLRCDYPIGVDYNKAHAIVTSPNAGEKLVLFVIADAKKPPFPKGVESNLELRSIK